MYPFKEPSAFLRAPKLWLFLFVLWLSALCVASSLHTGLPVQSPKIPHFDKFLHYAYFLCGSMVFNTWLLLKLGRESSSFVRHLIIIILFGIFGATDEYRQTFTPGRSGNDLYDWFADILGACTGLFFAHLFHPLLLKFSSPKFSSDHI